MNTKRLSMARFVITELDGEKHTIEGITTDEFITEFERVWRSFSSTAV